MVAPFENMMTVEVRLEAGQPGVFAPAATELNMPAEKHTGYAVQWFGLAVGALHWFRRIWIQKTEVIE